MGRGRAKAKQTKVARELKYFSPETDLDRLRAELAGGSGAGNGHRAPADRSTSEVDDVVEDAEADDTYVDDEDEPDWSPRR